jgi:Phage portal protein, SPP1 Gp6-like
MDVQEIIRRGLRDLGLRQAKYSKLARYYDGDHDLAFATQKFRNAFGNLFNTFSDNLTPAVVNGFADNLRVDDFTVEEGSTGEADSAWRVWQSNFMEQRSAELHRELLKSGDAYVIVWQDAKGKPTIYPNKAQLVTVGYDDEQTGQIVWALKVWRTSRRTVRLNVFLPDRIEKYETAAQQQIDRPAVSEFSEFGTLPGPNAFQLVETIANPFGMVPVFHFAINCDIGEFGKSELENVIPLNDALNKMLLDMLVASEFGAFRQRWATGIEIHTDAQGQPLSPFTAGASGVWVTDSEKARFGDFDVTNLDQYIKVQESIRAEIARVTSLPLHYLMLHAQTLATGRALQTAERRFQSKIQNLQNVIGARWSKVLWFALTISGISEKSIRLFTQWQDVSTISELEFLQSLQAKKAIGVSLRQLMTEAGYGQADIDRIEGERQKEAAAAAAVTGSSSSPAGASGQGLSALDAKVAVGNAGAILDKAG